MIIPESQSTAAIVEVVWEPRKAFPLTKQGIGGVFAPSWLGFALVVVFVLGILAFQFVANAVQG